MEWKVLAGIGGLLLIGALIGWMILIIVVITTGQTYDQGFRDGMDFADEQHYRFVSTPLDSDTIGKSSTYCGVTISRLQNDTQVYVYGAFNESCPTWLSKELAK